MIRSRFQRLRELLAQAIEAITIRCAHHGFQPAVLACPCAVSYARPLAVATMEGVFCIDHVGRFEIEDPAADDDLAEHCFQCMIDRGVLW